MTFHLTIWRLLCCKSENEKMAQSSDAKKVKFVYRSMPLAGFHDTHVVDSTTRTFGSYVRDECALIRVRVWPVEAGSYYSAVDVTELACVGAVPV